MSDGDYDRELREDEYHELVEGIVVEFQSALDDVHRWHGGEPVEDVEEMLRSAVDRFDTVDVPDGEIRKWARLISRGERAVADFDD